MNASKAADVPQRLLPAAACLDARLCKELQNKQIAKTTQLNAALTWL
jgi:hypothetical protein